MSHFLEKGMYFLAYCYGFDMQNSFHFVTQAVGSNRCYHFVSVLQVIENNGIHLP